MEDSDRFVTLRRPDRLRPRFLSSRYHVLRQLGRALQEIAASDLLPVGEVIVDYGCAGRPYEGLFRPKFERYVGADLPGNPVADIVIDSDGCLPLDAGTVSCVLSSQVLEHLPSPHRYLIEARRVLRPAGHLILSTHGTWPYHADPHDYRRWTLEGLRFELTNAGFRPLLERAILGQSATALQLLQDAIGAALPGPAAAANAALFQTLIGLAERLRRDPLPHDACVFVTLAERAE